MIRKGGINTPPFAISIKERSCYMKIFFSQSVTDTMQELQVNPNTGLTSEEADKRLSQHGHNRLEGGKEKSIFQMTLEQLKDFLVIILIIVGF